MSRCQEPTGRHYLRQLLSRRDDIAVYPEDALSYAGPPDDLYFYRPGELLVLHEQVPLFQRIAREVGLQYCCCEDGGRPAAGERSPTDDALEAHGTARFIVRSRSSLEVILGRLERASHRELKVTPNHVVFGCPGWLLEPYGDPKLPLDDPEIELERGGDGVTVAVVDCGVPGQYQQNSLLAPVQTSVPEEEPWLYSGPVPVLSYPQGHGSFVAGVVRQAAAQARVTSYRALDTDGVTDEWYLGNQLALILSAVPAPGVVNLSLGTFSRADQPLIGLAALAGAASQEGHEDGPIVVASAGNYASPRPFFPAADSWAIGVGAAQLVGDDPVPAVFSNFGPWVDFCANGVDVLSAFEAKPYRPLSDPSTLLSFQGFALWSGTSFAAAHVSGVVARLLQQQPGLGRDGAMASLAALAGGVAVPGLGRYVP